MYFFKSRLQKSNSIVTLPSLRSLFFSRRSVFLPARSPSPLLHTSCGIAVGNLHSRTKHPTASKVSTRCFAFHDLSLVEGKHGESTTVFTLPLYKKPTDFTRDPGKISRCHISLLSSRVHSISYTCPLAPRLHPASIFHFLFTPISCPPFFHFFFFFSSSRAYPLVDVLSYLTIFSVSLSLFVSFLGLAQIRLA